MHACMHACMRVWVHGIEKLPRKSISPLEIMALSNSNHHERTFRVGESF